MLSNKAVMVRLSIGQPRLKMVDRTQTASVQASTGAKAGAVEVVKFLIDKDSYDPIKKLINQIRAYHYERTAPWIDDGTRILSNAGFMAYSQGMSQFRVKLEGLANELVDHYADLYTKTMLSQGTMFNEMEFPQPEILRERIYLRTNFLPVPQSGDFRLDGVDDATKAQMDADLMRIENEALRTAMDDVRSRMLGVVSKMAETLGGESNRFHNTLVTNVSDLCDLLPSLNFADDTLVDQIGRDIKDKLTCHSSEQLKNNDTLREAVAKDAQQLANKMGSLWG